MGYFDDYCLFSRYLEIFQLSLFDFQFDSVVKREYSLNDTIPLKFIKICFMVQNMIYLGECSICLKTYFLLLLSGVTFIEMSIRSVD